MKKEGLPASARLKSKKQIEQLFAEGKKLHSWPLLLIYLEVGNDDRGAPVQFGVSVSRRKLKRAVDRNLVKRRIREAYRTNRRKVWDKWSGEKRALQVFFIYLAGDVLPYDQIEKAVKSLHEKLLGE